MADNNNQQETARAVYPLMDISAFPPITLPRPQKRTNGNGYDFDNYSVDLLARSNGSLAGAVHVGYLFDILREVLIPTIDNETRNWFVGNVDTGVKAEGRTPAFRYYETEEEGEEKKKRVLQVGYYETNSKGEKVFSGAQDLLDIDALVPYFAWIKLDDNGKVDEAGGELWLTYSLGGVTYKLIAADRLKLRFSDLTPEDIAVLQAPVRAVVAEAWAALERANTAAQTAEDAAALATGAVAESNAATARANTAADGANAAAKRVTDAILDIAAEKKAALEAAAAANTAAGNADTAAKGANDAASSANTAKTNADTAAQSANDAASAATTAKTNADTAAQSANDAASAATTAKTNADTAAQSANDAASAATAAAKSANAAAATVDAAVAAAGTATTAANNAAAKAEKASQHPPTIDPSTSTWKLWDADNDRYEATNYPSRGIQGPKGDNAHSPRINSTTSTWEVYDDTAQKYVDTGVQVNSTYTLTANGIAAALGFTPANSSHTHDDRYYTETEIDTKLNGKAASGHTHDDRYYTETEIDTKLNGKAASDHTHNSIKDAGDGRVLQFNYSTAALAYDKFTWIAVWNGNTLQSVNKSVFAPASHTHDDRYYTETEVNTKLTDGSVSKVGTTNVGSASRPVYLNAGVPTAGTYTFGNASGNAPISNGTVNTNLNADMIDGLHASNFMRSYGTLWNNNETVADWAKRIASIVGILTRSDWSWAQSTDLSIGSYSIDSQRYSAIDFRAGNLNNSWQQKAYLFLPTYSDSSMIYIVQMSTSSTAGVVTTSVKRYADYDTILASNVASATKLQTARTLTIGNTGKTFNGEGNVSWNLAEIGAAPLGANAVTALNAVPIDKPLVIATINSATAQTFGLANTTVPAGREIHVIINNTSSGSLTVALPTAAVYKNCCGEASITIEAGKYGEISAVSNGSNIFLRAIGS